jgi:hypothetical protein
MFDCGVKYFDCFNHVHSLLPGVNLALLHSTDV